MGSIDDRIEADNNFFSSSYSYAWDNLIHQMECDGSGIGLLVKLECESVARGCSSFDLFHLRFVWFFLVSLDKAYVCVCVCDERWDSIFFSFIP